MGNIFFSHFTINIDQDRPRKLTKIGNFQCYKILEKKYYWVTFFVIFYLQVIIRNFAIIIFKQNSGVNSVKFIDRHVTFSRAYFYAISMSLDGTVPGGIFFNTNIFNTNFFNTDFLYFLTHIFCIF